MKEAVLRSLVAIGVDLRKARTAIREIPHFVKTVAEYREQASDHTALALHLNNLYPILTDRLEEAGAVGGHYFYQDLWAARKIFERRPDRHVDVGSRIDGFIAHLLTFMPVLQVDIRPLKSAVPRLSFIQDDATLMASFPDNSVPSLSSLHVVEHFGLGRYGDPVEPQAWKRAVRSLVRVLQPGGRLYFSLPVGRERLEFNAHRILSPDSIMDAFHGLQLVSFAAVHDDGSFDFNAVPADVRDETSACGLFEFTKQ